MRALWRKISPNLRDIVRRANKDLKKPNFVPQFLINYFNRDIMSRTTRQSDLLHLPRVRTESVKSSFFIMDVLFLIVYLESNSNIAFL